MKLSTTLQHVNSISHRVNAEILKEFYEYLKREKRIEVQITFLINKRGISIGSRQNQSMNYFTIGCLATMN
jgi:hypothetical protein